MRLGRRLSAGIAEDPPTPAPEDTADTGETAIPAHEITAERREPAEQLVDR